MDFKAFYQGLPADQRKRFAEIAGTTTGYIEVHLMTRRKMPKKALMAALANACLEFKAPITQDDLLAFFYRTSSSEQSSAQPATA